MANWRETHGLDMAGCRGLQLLAPSGGEFDPPHSGIGVASDPGHIAVPAETVDPLRQPTRRVGDRTRKVGHAQPVPVGFAQPHEHLVIVGGEAGIALELTIGGREHAAAGVDPTPPGELFGLGKPANIGVFGVDVCCRAGGGCHAVQPSGFRFNVEVVPCQHTGCGQHPKITRTTGFDTVRNLGITPILVGNMGISGKPGRPP